MSCDLLPTEQPGPHFEGDILEILNAEKWDMLIAHPPCTYLCNSGVHLLHRDPTRWKKMIAAADFFSTLLSADIPRIAVENPVMHKYAIQCIGVKHNQTIQPYHFGHDASKRTCLWLKNLPPLQPTKEVYPSYVCKCGARSECSFGKYGCPNCGRVRNSARPVWGNQTPSGQNKLGPSKNRRKLRSRTYRGIAQAMSKQWGALL